MGGVDGQASSVLHPGLLRKGGRGGEGQLVVLAPAFTLHVIPLVLRLLPSLFRPERTVNARATARYVLEASGAASQLPPKRPRQQRLIDV